MKSHAVRTTVLSTLGDRDWSPLPVGYAPAEARNHGNSQIGGRFEGRRLRVTTAAGAFPIAAKIAFCSGFRLQNETAAMTRIRAATDTLAG
jgi:hypothetical protein